MKGLILFFSITTICTCSYAQVQYTAISPTKVITGTGKPNNLDSVKLHLAHPLGTVLGIDSALHLWHFDPAPPSSNDVGADCRGSMVELLELAGTPAPGPAAIDSGKMINASAGTWKVPKYIRLAIDGAADNWDGRTDKYLGVRFKRGTNWHYGWIKMSIDNPTTKLELKGYAYEKTAGTGIVAGNKGAGSSTGIKELSQLNVKPQVDNKIVSFSNVQERYSISIMDMTGRILYSGMLDEYNTKVNLQFAPSGMYAAHLQMQGQAATFKFVLQ